MTKIGKQPKMSNKIWICSGERSGDGYGAELIEQLKTKSPNLEIQVMGGEKMASTGVEVMVRSEELAVMGVTEVIGLLPTFIKLMNQLVTRAKKERPDAVILIDFPGFNLRLARRLHSIGIRVMWYISPKVWAWGKSRIDDLVKICDPMMVIFPFEEDFFKPTGMNIKFVGHPLVAMLQSTFNNEIKREPNTMLLLPGSRYSELKAIFPRMLESLYIFAERHPQYRYIIAATDEKKARFLETQLAWAEKKWGKNQKISFTIVIDKTLEWMQKAEVGFAASGTVTMECAIAGLPLVSVYAVNGISFYFFKAFVQLYRRFFTMINIIENRCIYEEFFQYFIHPFMIVPALERIIIGGERRAFVESELTQFSEHLSGGKTDAIECAADTILESLQSPRSCQKHLFKTTFQKGFKIMVYIMILIFILLVLMTFLG